MLRGAWQVGALGFSISAGVAVFGVGEVVRGADRAVGLALVIVGALGVFGHVAQFFLFR